MRLDFDFSLFGKNFGGKIEGDFIEVWDSGLVWLLVLTEPFLNRG